ncbi:hypothetical protein IMSHALPRED_010142 [Imshaugia aleurites]|uniref:Gag-like protein n=1 Tax=Imshaugia aleurites TaxID=172621 RepID=A0A8H3G258_9LECA|nr:hypothetical protein IMSHALPRED_010142 [Imshaugia aleurites]
MSKSKKDRKRKTQPPKTQITYPRRAAQHAVELAQEFAQISHHVENSRKGHCHHKLPSGFKKKMNEGVQRVVATGLSKRICAKFSSSEDRVSFQNMISAMICDLYSFTVPQEMFDALEKSFRCLVPKIQALEFASQHTNWYPAASRVSNEAAKDADALLSSEAATLSINHEVIDSTNDEISDCEKAISKPVVQPAIRLQGSVDLSPDLSDSESDLEGGLENDLENVEESVKCNKVDDKEENGEEAAATVPPDPTIFTVTLGIPIAPDDHRFSIRFNNERVVHGLRCMPSREIWQLAHDAIQQDPNIPNRTSSLPRITEVGQYDDGRLAFRIRTKEDLELLSTNVQWARNLRNTVSAGIKTYRVEFECVKTRTIQIPTNRDRALIIDKIREENSEKIPSLNQIGAIRDIEMLQDLAFERERNDHADYLLVFGSREAANAALKMGLLLCNNRRAGVVYEPGTQWHQQCSRCQGHNHRAKDCHSTPLCGKCGYKHATQYCTSATIECANCHGNHMASSKKCLKWLKAEESAHRSYRFPAEESELQTPNSAEPPTTTLPPLPSPPPRRQPSLINPAPRPPTSSHAPPATKPPAPLQTPPSNSSPHMPTANTATPSAILETIDAFRAFVAARENPSPGNKRCGTGNANMGLLMTVVNSAEDRRRCREAAAVVGTAASEGERTGEIVSTVSGSERSGKVENFRKRKEPSYVMAGALQGEGRGGKRVKCEGGGEGGEGEEGEEEGLVWPIGLEGVYCPPSLRGWRGGRGGRG